MKKLLPLFFVLLLFVGCSKKEEPKIDEVKDDKKSEVSLKSQKLPFEDLSFDTIDIEGERFKSSDYFEKSEKTLVVVWSSSCSDCTAELKEIKKLDDDTQNKNLQVLGIIADTQMSSATNVEEAKAKIEETAVEFKNIIPNPTLDQYMKEFKEYPTMFYVDKYGKVVSDAYTEKLDYKNLKDIFHNISDEKK